MIGFVDDDWFPDEPLYSGHGSTAHTRPPRRKVSIRSHGGHVNYRGWSAIRKAKK